MKSRDINKLTPREVEIIALVAKKKRPKEIAVDLDISDFTVRSHLGNIRLKLKVNNTIGAVLAALEQGFITV